MKRQVAEKRWEGIDRAKELLDTAREREFTQEEIEELKRLHTGYGGLYRYNGGQFFTPETVADFMVDLISLKSGMTVLEPACGAGAFLNSLYKKNTNISVVGIELSYELAEVGKICYPNAKIINGDALVHFKDFEQKVDIVIGNPPFGKTNVKYSGFARAKNGRLEEHFLEAAVRCLKDGGEAILIMPDSILSNASTKNLREWLLQECYYLATISLPCETFYFSGTSVKTSIMYFKKKYRNASAGDYPVFMAICENIGWNGRGQKTGRCDLEQIKKKYLSFKPVQFSYFRAEGKGEA